MKLKHRRLLVIGERRNGCSCPQSLVPMAPSESSLFETQKQSIGLVNFLQKESHAYSCVVEPLPGYAIVELV
jgi:hypothetical protein